MNLTVSLLPIPLFWVAWLVFLLLLGLAVYTAPWKRLGQRGQIHVYLGSCVVLMMMWSLNAGIHPGLSFHLLGGTLLLLMYGWQLAFVAISLVAFGIAVNGGLDWTAFGLNDLIMVGVPVFFSLYMFKWTLRRLSHHFFVYVMIDGYLCGGLAMAATIAVSTALMLCCSHYTWDDLTNKYLVFAPMAIFVESFFTGMLATGMALFRPEWIWSFDDRRYLYGK